MEQKYKTGDKVIVHHPGTMYEEYTGMCASWNISMNRCHGQHATIVELDIYSNDQDPHYKVTCENCDLYPQGCIWAFHQDWLVPDEPVLEVYFRREKLYKKIDL